METNDSIMERKQESCTTVSCEEENLGVWFGWMKTAVESCVLLCSHVKVEPLREMAAKEGQTRGLKYEDEVAQENSTKGRSEAIFEDKSELVKVCEDKSVIQN